MAGDSVQIPALSRRDLWTRAVGADRAEKLHRHAEAYSASPGASAIFGRIRAPGSFDTPVKTVGYVRPSDIPGILETEGLDSRVPVDFAHKYRGEISGFFQADLPGQKGPPEDVAFVDVSSNSRVSPLDETVLHEVAHEATKAYPAPYIKAARRSLPGDSEAFFVPLRVSEEDMTAAQRAAQAMYGSRGSLGIRDSVDRIRKMETFPVLLELKYALEKKGIDTTDPTAIQKALLRDSLTVEGGRLGNWARFLYNWRLSHDLGESSESPNPVEAVSRILPGIARAPVRDVVHKAGDELGTVTSRRKLWEDTVGKARSDVLHAKAEAYTASPPVGRLFNSIRTPGTSESPVRVIRYGDIKAVPGRLKASGFSARKTAWYPRLYGSGLDGFFVAGVKSPAGGKEDLAFVNSSAGDPGIPLHEVSHAATKSMPSFGIGGGSGDPDKVTAADVGLARKVVERLYRFGKAGHPGLRRTITRHFETFPVLMELKRSLELQGVDTTDPVEIEKALHVPNYQPTGHPRLDWFRGLFSNPDSPEAAPAKALSRILPGIVQASSDDTFGKVS